MWLAIILGQNIISSKGMSKIIQQLCVVIFLSKTKKNDFVTCKICWLLLQKWVVQMEQIPFKTTLLQLSWQYFVFTGITNHINQPSCAVHEHMIRKYHGCALYNFVTDFDETVLSLKWPYYKHCYLNSYLPVDLNYQYYSV